jgi:hypothetical protein
MEVERLEALWYNAQKQAEYEARMAATAGLVKFRQV